MELTLMVRLLCCLQARAFYGFQIAIENIHSGEPGLQFPHKLGG